VALCPESSKLAQAKGGSASKIMLLGGAAVTTCACFGALIWARFDHPSQDPAATALEAPIPTNPHGPPAALGLASWPVPEMIHDDYYPAGMDPSAWKGPSMRSEVLSAALLEVRAAIAVLAEIAGVWESISNAESVPAAEARMARLMDELGHRL
jgi:hypothetical protein